MALYALPYCCLSFDDQRATSYSLVVRALSVAGVEASTTLTVQVGDVNDSPPLLQRVRYGRSLRLVDRGEI